MRLGIRKGLPLLALAVLASACGRGPNVTEPRAGDDYPPAIQAYMAEWTAVEGSASPRSLEPLMQAAEGVQDAVMLIDDSQLAWLERLDDGAFARLQADVPGFVFHRGYDIHAEIDGDALLTLAQRKGRTADQAFFTQYVASYNDQALPLYLRFAGGASPCIRFGEPVLVDQYRQWRRFRLAHPGAYDAFTARWLADIEDAVAQATCTCTQDQPPVEATLADFNRAFPDNPAADRIDSRLAQLKDEPYARPVWCR